MTRASVRKAALEHTDSALEYVKRRLGTSATKEEIAEDIEASIDEAIAGRPIASRVPAEVLPAIFADGRFKTQYETGSSRGSFNPRMRMDAETDTFDLTRETPIDQFPIYGFVHTEGYKNDPIRYGDVRIEFKNSVKSRTTVTVGDSLGGMVGAEIAPSPPSRAHKDRGCWDGGPNLLHLAAGNPERISYFEAQIHGGVTLDDIKRVVLPPFHQLRPGVQRRMSDIERIAKEKGIEISYEESHPYSSSW